MRSGQAGGIRRFNDEGIYAMMRIERIVPI